MITINIDISDIKKNETALVIEDNLSYINAYKTIQDCLSKGNPAEVIIKKNVYKVWINRLSERHPGVFIFNEISLRSLLEENWDIAVPSYVTDRDIEGLLLLEMTKKPSKDVSFENFLLGVYYSTELQGVKFEIDTIPGLMNDFDKEKWDINGKHALLKKLFDQKLNHWHDTSSRDLKRIIYKISNDIVAFRKELIHYHILKSYKNLLNHHVPDYYLYDALKINTNKLKYIEGELKDLIQILEYEINSWEEPDSKEEFTVFIDKMSGLLLFEFEKIKGLLTKKASLLSIDTIKALEAKFHVLSNLIKGDIERLKSSIPPEVPEEPALDWDVDQMLTWCIKEYFPYFKWAIKNSDDLSIITELGNVFSTWYYKEYHNIIANNKSILYKFLQNNYETFSTVGAINIVLIIDNLPWILVKAVQESFNKYGFQINNLEPYFSMLPTLTEVSKKCLLTGQDRYSKIEEKTYKEILESKGWVPYFEDSHFKYFPNIGTLKKFKDLAPGAYFVNYLEIDEIFHKSEEVLGMSHEEYIKDYLVKLVEILYKVLKQYGLENHVNIHVISDHGATLLRPNFKNEMDFDYFKGIGFIQASNRYMILDVNSLVELPSYVKDKCFVLEEAKFGTLSNYIVPIKNYSFLKVKETIWSHGGILPEEVVIPHMVFRRVDIVIAAPEVILAYNSFRYAIQSIEMDIGNPNDYVMEEIYVTILNTNFESEQSTKKIEKIRPKNKTLVSFEGKFKQTNIKREREVLEITIRCSIKSMDYRFDVECPITFKSMVETKGEDVFDHLDY